MFGRKIATKENILALVTEYDIFKYYINSFRELNRPFSSELSRDRNPSCRIFLTNNNTLKYQDFRETETLDCFGYLKFKYGLNYFEVLDLINRDFNLNLIPNTTRSLPHSLLEKEILLHGDNYLSTKRSQKQIKVELGEWNGSIHKRYWFDQYGLKVEDLKRYNVYPIKSFWIIDENGDSLFFKAATLSFGYYFGKNELDQELWKIYQPYSDIKWISNTTIEVLQGYMQLKDRFDLLIITKALKDVMVLDKAEIDSVAPNAESCMISDFKMQELKSKYKKIVVLFDDDKTGNKGSEKLCKLYNLERTFLPSDTEKDVSDYVAKYGYDSLKELLKDLI